MLTILYTFYVCKPFSNGSTKWDSIHILVLIYNSSSSLERELSLIYITGPHYPAMTKLTVQYSDVNAKTQQLISISMISLHKNPP